MFNDGEKALLLVKDRQLRNKMEDYLSKRYGLLCETAEDLLEVLSRVGDTAPYEMVILDEEVAGLPATSHARNTIKDKDVETKVMYLSVLKEFTEPYFPALSKVPPRYADEDFRDYLIDRQMDFRLLLNTPITNAASREEIYKLVSDNLSEAFKPDHALCTILRLDEKPVTRGTVATNCPPCDPDQYYVDIAGTGHMEDLVNYFKPIHVPDMEKEPELREELEEKFSMSIRSALIVPLHMELHCIGYIAMFNHKSCRLYNLAEIDLVQQLADFATVGILINLYRQHGNLKMPPKDDDRIIR